MQAHLRTWSKRPQSSTPFRGLRGMVRWKAADNELLQLYWPVGSDFLWRSLLRFSPLAAYSALGSLCHQWLGQQEAVGMYAQNLKRIYPLFTHRASAGGFYSVSLVCNIVAKHGRALRRREKKKVLMHSTVSLSPFIVKPQNAKPADRIPQTTLQSNSGLLSFAAYQNYFHTIPAFFRYKLPCPFSLPLQMYSWGAGQLIHAVRTV